MRVVVIAALAALAQAAAPAQAPAPPPRVGDGWGTNIHWTAETAEGEAAMMARAFRLARMDFHWSVIEQSRGAYNFTEYDGLLATMEAHGIRPYWILDYGNPLYPPVASGPDCSAPGSCKAQCQNYFGTCSDGTYYCCGGVLNASNECRGHHLCPTNDKLEACACNAGDTSLASGGSTGCDTPECIEAFGKFAAATVAHFKGHRIIFECINEPNGMGHDNATTLAALCLSAGKAFTDAGELFVGPTTASFDWKYLNESMASGILGAFGAVSVHPYRPTAPDTVLPDWTRLRAMIEQYGSTERERSMPMLSGEWGYTSAVPPCAYGNRCSENTQAAYLARMWLSNTMAGVDVSVNYVK